MCRCTMYRWRFDELFTDVQYWAVLCVVQVGYGLGGGGVKTVLVSGCFGAQCSVAPARGQQFNERVSRVWGVQSDRLSPFPHSSPRVSRVWGVQSDRLSPFPHSGGVQFLETMMMCFQETPLQTCKLNRIYLSFYKHTIIHVENHWPFSQ